MPHSYVSNMVHYIFGTKERFPFIDAELESRLWPYMGGIARENGMKALVIGGTRSGFTMNYRNHRKFEWQDGYGALVSAHPR